MTHLAIPWEHGLRNGTDYNGGQPYSLARDIVFHEEGGDTEIAGMDINPEDAEAWRHWLPRIYFTSHSPEIPRGCGYLVDAQGVRVAFILDTDLTPTSVIDVL